MTRQLITYTKSLFTLASVRHGQPAITSTIDNITLTYKDLERKCSFLNKLISTNNKKVAIMLPFSSVHFGVAIYFACTSGRCFLPMNPHHPYELLRYYINDFKPDILLTSKQYSLDYRLRQSNRIMCIDESSYSNEVNASESREHNEDNDLLILYTSGTTGKPKGVLHTQRSITAQVNDMIDVWNWNAGDRIMQVLPLHHIHGLVNCLITPLAVGAHCILNSKDHFNAEQVFNRLLSDNPPITVFMAVPTIYSKILDYYKNQSFTAKEKQDIRHRFSKQLRLMVSGSAALPDYLYHGFLHMTGKRIVEQYGSTETGRCMSIRPDLESKDLAGKIMSA
ncbi:hypothetical protein GJ496_011819 [Pomphorhynchus laevis]|nr:hypothetical protein GJ496_011819 [Pomphorhynchus laevis]